MTSLVLQTLLIGFLLPAGCQAQSNGDEKTDTTVVPTPPTAAQEAKRDPLQIIDAFIESENIDKSNPSWRLRVNRPPQLEFDPATSYYWLLETNHGQIKLQLFTDVAFEGASAAKWDWMLAHAPAGAVDRASASGCRPVRTLDAPTG